MVLLLLLLLIISSFVWINLFWFLLKFLMLFLVLSLVWFLLKSGFYVLLIFVIIYFGLKWISCVKDLLDKRSEHKNDEKVFNKTSFSDNDFVEVIE